jgi:hypothetical protein
LDADSKHDVVTKIYRLNLDQSSTQFKVGKPLCVGDVLQDEFENYWIYTHNGQFGTVKVVK